MTLPLGVIRDVLTREHPDALLHLLAKSEKPLLYTEARAALGHHPEEFKRALAALEKWALVQLRVVPLRERPDARRRVRLELTSLGHAVVSLHGRIESAWKQIAHDHGLDEGAFVMA